MHFVREVEYLSEHRLLVSFEDGSRRQVDLLPHLNGPLGAGKTMLVKGIASALGIDQEDVTSPSFTLVNPHPGRLLLYHIDLYRLDEGAAAAHAVDLDEILTDENAVVIIEWAERLGHYPLPEDVWRVSISGDGDEPRRIAVSTGNAH